MEFLFLVHGVAVGYDFPKAADPVVGIVLWTRNEVQVFPLVFEDDGKAAILWYILGVFFHTFCFMAWPHIPNIFNGDCGKKAEPVVSRGSVTFISIWWWIFRNYSFSFSCNLSLPQLEDSLLFSAFHKLCCCRKLKWKGTDRARKQTYKTPNISPLFFSQVFYLTEAQNTHGCHTVIPYLWLISHCQGRLQSLGHPCLDLCPCLWVGGWIYASSWTGAGNPVGLSTFLCKSGPGFITETIIFKCPTCDTDIQRQELPVSQIYAPFHASEKGHQKSLIAFVASSVCIFLTHL